MKLSRKLLIILSLSAVFIFTGLGCSKKDSSGGVFKSNDKGETWEQKVLISQEKKNSITIAGLNVNLIIQDNLNPDTFYIATTTDGIYGTASGGNNWKKIGLSGDISDLAIDQTDSQTLIAARSNIIYKTHESFEKIDNIYINPEKSPVISVLIDSYDSKRYFAGTKDGLFLVSVDGGATWMNRYQFNDEIKNIIQSTQDTRVLYTITKKGLYKSVDAGVAWEKLTDNLKDFKGASNIYGFFIDPSNYLHIYLGTDYGILVSDNGGSSFVPIKTLVPFGKLPIKVLAINPGNLNEIYFAVSNIIHKSNDGGQTWRTIETIPTVRNISCIVIDENDPNTIYIGVKLIKK